MAKNRATLTFDGEKIDVVEAVFAMHTAADPSGMPMMQTLNTTVQCRIDLHDIQNIKFQTLKKLFDLSNVATREKIKDMKIELWDDDSKQNVICSFKCKAWISSFRVSNIGGDTGATYNNVLDIELRPVHNQANYQEITLGN
ncbi:MAG TPA: hypothetical protein VJZ77_24985 [Blastocatellia bacterium]|nr:hypothetical protein [Blastocatellia bacterium]